MPQDAPPVDRSDIHVRLLRLFASPTYQPPLLPAVALEMMQLSQRPNVGFDDVIGVLEKDPVLAGRVLSIAQSAVYAPRSPILSLKHAAVRLGLKTLRELVLEAALKMRVFRVPGYEGVMSRLSQHSTATAYVIRALCRKTAIEAEYAFMCGLLHDVGIAACLLALSDDKRSGALPLAALAPALDEVHEEASGIVARLWGLPQEIQAVVASHHDVVVGGTPHPVNAALVVAEGIIQELDLGIAPRGSSPDGEIDVNPPELFDSACVALRLREETLAAARAEAQELVSSAVSAAA